MRILTLLPACVLLTVCSLTPLLAEDDAPLPGSYTEVHRWIPAWIEVLPDGVEVHHAGYWLVTRRDIPPADAPLASEPPPALAPCECSQPVEAASAEVVCVPGCAADPYPRPLFVATITPCAPVCVRHGFWRSIAWGWHDPACYRGSVAESGASRAGERHGNGGEGQHVGHGGWSLPRLPFSPLAPLALLAHLHR